MSLIDNVVVNSGTVDNGTSKKLNVVIPQGMSGKQLIAWKIKNETSIVEAIEEPSEEQSEEGDSNSANLVSI